jgi:hypothetical protein
MAISEGPLEIAQHIADSTVLGGIVQRLRQEKYQGPGGGRRGPRSRAGGVGERPRGRHARPGGARRRRAPGGRLPEARTVTRGCSEVE